MKTPFSLVAGMLLPIIRPLLTPFPGFRMVLVKLCILLEEKREPEDSLRWLFELHKFTEEWIDRQAVAWGNGVHLKHHVMEGIHSFFCERIPPGAHVLDVGCGIGALAHAIARSVKGVQVVGVDYDAQHIKFASERYKETNLRFMEGDATNALPEKSFEVIVLSSVLEHLNDRVGFLKKLVFQYNPALIFILVPTSIQTTRLSIQ